MRPILSASAYETVLRGLSEDEVREVADAVAGEAKRLMGRHGLRRAVILCGEPLRRIGELAAKQLNGSIAFPSNKELPELSDAIICDLLFSADAGAWGRAIAGSCRPFLSVAIPAGVDPDTGKAGDDALHAEITVAPFGYLPGLFLHDGLDHCGQIRPVGDGTDVGDGLFRFEDDDAGRLLPPRKRTAHKGDSGKALLCVGSPKYIGAALLSARACLAAGCGILYVACPHVVRSALSRLPEAIGIPVGEDWDSDSCRVATDALAGMKALGMGCGIGSGDVSALIEAALKTGLPLVLDADGLNCLSRHPELYSLLHEQVVLTPHPGEMSRLTGLSVERVLEDPLTIAQRYASLWGCTVLLKGAATVVSYGRRTRIVAEGNAGLGKGGSGDVLTGIITGLLAQGVEPFTAACLGSYLLGTSAEKAFALLKERMLRASDVIEALKYE